MNILVCNDTRGHGMDEALNEGRKKHLSGEALQAWARESINLDGGLCWRLRAHHHHAVLFDGYTGKDFKIQIKENRELAFEIERLILAEEIEGLILDLNWFGDFHAGVHVFRKLLKDQCISTEMRAQTLIYSRFANDTDYGYKDVLTKEFGLAPHQILVRNGVKVEDVVGLIDTWAKKQR